MRRSRSVKRRSTRRKSIKRNKDDGKTIKYSSSAKFISELSRPEILIDYEKDLPHKELKKQNLDYWKNELDFKDVKGSLDDIKLNFSPSNMTTTANLKSVDVDFTKSDNVFNMNSFEKTFTTKIVKLEDEINKLKDDKHNRESLLKLHDLISLRRFYSSFPDLNTSTGWSNITVNLIPIIDEYEDGEIDKDEYKKRMETILVPNGITNFEEIGLMIKYNNRRHNYAHDDIRTVVKQEDFIRDCKHFDFPKEFESFAKSLISQLDILPKRRFSGFSK